MKVKDIWGLNQIVEWLSGADVGGGGVTLYYSPEDREPLGWVHYQPEGLATSADRARFWNERLCEFEPAKGKRLDLHLRRSSSGNWDPNARKQHGCSEKRCWWAGNKEPEQSSARSGNGNGVAIHQAGQLLPPGLGAPAPAGARPFITATDAQGLVIQLLNIQFQERQQKDEMWREQLAAKSYENRLLQYALIQQQVTRGEDGSNDIDLKELIGLTADNADPLLTAFRALREDPESPEWIKNLAGSGVPLAKLLKEFSERKGGADAVAAG